MTQSEPVLTTLRATKVELLANVLRRCMGIEGGDNARHDFGDFNGGALQRPTEVAAELLNALSDENLTLAAQSPVQPVLSGLIERWEREAKRRDGDASRRDDPVNILAAAIYHEHADALRRLAATAPAADEVRHDDTPHFMGEFDLTPRSRTCALCFADPATPNPEQDR